MPMQLKNITYTKISHKFYKYKYQNDKSKLSDKKCRNSALKSTILRAADNILASLILTILIQSQQNNPIVTLSAYSWEKHL